MLVITYRSVDESSDAVKYVCEHAYVIGPYVAEWGPTDVDAETVLCLNCINRLNECEEEVRVHAPNPHKMQMIETSTIH